MIPEEEPFPFFIMAEETGQKNRNLQDFLTLTVAEKKKSERAPKTGRFLALLGVPEMT